MTNEIESVEEFKRIFTHYEMINMSWFMGYLGSIFPEFITSIIENKVEKKFSRYLVFIQEESAKQ